MARRANTFVEKGSAIYLVTPCICPNPTNFKPKMLLISILIVHSQLKWTIKLFIGGNFENCFWNYIARENKFQRIKSTLESKWLWMPLRSLLEETINVCWWKNYSYNFLVIDLNFAVQSFIFLRLGTQDWPLLVSVKWKIVWLHSDFVHFFRLDSIWLAIFQIIVMPINMGDKVIMGNYPLENTEDHFSSYDAKSNKKITFE